MYLTRADWPTTWSMESGIQAKWVIAAASLFSLQET